MTEMIDKIHFQDLLEQNPKDVCRRALCDYNEKDKCYTMPIWGVKYRIFPHEFRIESLDENVQNIHEYFSLFMIQYLLCAKEIEPSQTWISEKDIPGGTTFFRGPHQIPTDLMTRRFNNNLDEFKKRCEQLKGVPLNMADAAYVFEIAPRIPVAVLYWIGDDEFPAESKILYDMTITEHLAADIVYALAVGICKRLGS